MEMITDRPHGAAPEGSDLEAVVTLRRAIHADPELGLHCPRTAQKLKAALADLPLEIREGPSTTGFVAILRGPRDGQTNGRTVLLRGDMDALPLTEETGLSFASQVAGRMHACGHDTHVAMLAGAARALCARRDRLAGNVAFLFQPGEEGHHGARFMIEDGLLDDLVPGGPNGGRPDAAFALHISPNLPLGTVASRPGPLMASTDTLRATIRGAGGHAAMPHECADPIPVACEIVTALQTFVARRVAVTDPCVLSITKIEAGFAHNVVPDTVELLGTLRTLSPETRALARAGFEQVAMNVAAAHGCAADVRIEQGYPVTVNDARAAALMRNCAEELGDWRTMPAPMMGAEDFSYVLERVPGAMAFIGAAAPGSDPAANPPLHNTRMTVDEGVLARGVAMHCLIAERFLENGLPEG